MFTWYQLLPLYFRDLGASDGQVGLAYSLMNLAYALLQLAGGLLSDRYGRKALIVVPTFCATPLYLLAGATTHWAALMAAMLAINSLSALQWPSFTSLIAESVAEEQQGTAFGVFEFCFGLGVTIGPALGAILLRAVPLRELLWATAGVTLLCALVRAVALRETAVQAHLPKTASLRYALPHRLRWLLVAACAFCTAMGLTVHGPFVSLHAKDVVHLSEAQINWLFAAGSLGATLLSLAGGRLVDRFGGRLVLAASSAGHFATLVLWASAPTLLAGLPVFVLSWVLMQISFIAYNTSLAQSTTTETRARVVGLFGTVTGIISTAAPSAGMLLRREWGSVAPFGAALGVGLLMVLVLVRASPRPEPAQESP